MIGCSSKANLLKSLWSKGHENVLLLQVCYAPISVSLSLLRIVGTLSWSCRSAVGCAWTGEKAYSKIENAFFIVAKNCANCCWSRSRNGRKEVKNEGPVKH